jgi:hypothetical protein
VDDLDEARIFLRSGHLQVGIDEFIVLCGLGRDGVIDEAAEKIAALYFAIKQHHAEEFIPGKMNRFKMAALTSHCVVKAQPLTHDDPDAARRLNAELAFCCALSIIHQMPVKAGQLELRSLLERVEGIPNVPLEAWIRNEVEQHEQWLRVKNVNTYPVFCGGAFLSLLWLYGSLRYQVLAS